MCILIIVFSGCSHGLLYCAAYSVRVMTSSIYFLKIRIAPVPDDVTVTTMPFYYAITNPSISTVTTPLLLLCLYNAVPNPSTMLSLTPPLTLYYAHHYDIPSTMSLYDI